MRDAPSFGAHLDVTKEFERYVMKSIVAYLGLRDASLSRKKTIQSLQKFTTTLVVLSPLAFMDVSYAAGLVFQDGFEDGTANRWSEDSGRNKCTVVRTALDGKAPQNGSYMLQCNWNGVVAWNDPASYETVALKSWNYSSEFLIRAWVRAGADVDHKFGSKWLRLYSSGAVNSFILDGQMEGSGGPIYSNIEKVDGVTVNYNNYGGASLGDTAWHKIELYFKQGLSNNAIVRVWVDGSLEHQKTGFSSNPGNKWYPLYLMSNWSSNTPEWEHDANNHVYWDNIEVYSDSGSGATGLMSDASIDDGSGGDQTTPNPPQSLRVVQ